MLNRPRYTHQMAERLNAWRSRFNARRSVARKEANVSSETREQLEASKVAGDAAFAKLAELRAAAANYIRLRHEMEALWKSIDDSAQELTGSAPPSARKTSDA